MSQTLPLAIALLAPFAQALIAGMRPRLLRDLAFVGLGVIGAGAIWGLLFAALDGRAGPRLVAAQPLPGASLAFAAEPLGLIFAAIIASIATLMAWHAAGYIRAQGEDDRSRLLRALAFVSAAAQGLALSDNLFALLLSAAGLALAASALIGQSRAAGAAEAAGFHLAVALCGVMGLLLPATAWTYAIAGDVTFETGGVLAAASPTAAAALLGMFAFGLVGIGLAPFHRALVAATAAEPPAAGFVIAATASAGVFGLMKVTLFILGPQMLAAEPVRLGLIVLAHGGALLAGLVALAKPTLRERIAYVALGQLGLAIGGVLVGAPSAAFGALLQAAAFCAGSAVLFMAVGAIESASARHAAHEIAGLGRLMPFTFAAFALAALAFAGMAPLGGAWARLWLAAGGAEAGLELMAGSIIVNGALAFAALAPTAARGAFAPAPSLKTFRPDAGSVAMIAPIGLGAALLVGLLFAVEPLARALGPTLGLAFSVGAP